MNHVASATPKPYRTRLQDVPHVGGLREDEGWINMQVQFLIDQKTCNSDKLLVGWTVLPPGARHDKHRHFHADEFLIVIKGHGLIYTDDGEEPSGEGDVIFTPRGHWHGFNNTGTEDVVLAWGWSGAGSLEAAGYEVPEGCHGHAHK
jgi:quercetin dioxygenase-like cupin family protein